MKIFYTFLKNHHACLKNFLNLKMDHCQIIILILWCDCCFTLLREISKLQCKIFFCAFLKKMVCFSTKIKVSYTNLKKKKKTNKQKKTISYSYSHIHILKSYSRFFHFSFLETDWYLSWAFFCNLFLLS